MRRIFTVVMLLITVTVVNAQDVQNPWHLIAFENEEETAFYNIEVITGIEANAQSITILLDNGMEFIHPLATTTFGFDPRREGTATANEHITFPQWNVLYANGRLHFSETVNGIAVYAVNGVLVAQFAGNHTEVSIDLVSGIYIVQADGRSAKLIVGANGNGGAAVRSGVEVKTSYDPNPTSLRAGNAIKIYWNITASNTTVSVEIPSVEKFYFTIDNSIIFTLENGNTIELADYKGIEFAVEPAQPVTNSKWDLERTLQYGGCTYAMRGVGIQHTIVFAAIHRDGVAFQSTFIDGTDLRYQWFPNSAINVAIWDAAKANPGSRLAVFVGPVWEYGITFPITHNSYPYIALVIATTGEQVRSVVESWAFNGNTNLIPTTVVQNADGSLTIKCKDINGNTHTHTFVNPS